MDLNQELVKRLDLLATKLGVSGTYLWAVLIRQARVELISDAIFITLNVVLLYGVWRWWKRIIVHELFDGGEEAGAVIVSLLSAVMTITSVVALCDVPALIFNPDYWALEQVMTALK